MSPAIEPNGIGPGSFLDLAKRRRSCRAYLPDRVPREHLELMLEAARLAPSACNKQPWRMVVVTDEALRMRLLEEGLLPGITMSWAKRAPVLVALGVRRAVMTHRLAPKVSGIDYALIDAGIAGEHLVLQATELGLGTCWIGWIRPRVVRKLVGWPSGISPLALLAVGKEAPDGGGPGTERLPLDDIVTWT